MTTPSSARAFDVRHVQLARAAFAALAAIMVTFSSDHSAAVGLSVFSGFAIATALVFGLSVWLVFPRGQRATTVLLTVVYAVAGMTAGIPGIRVDGVFFGVVIAWAFVAGLVEILGSVRQRRSDVASRDGLTVGIVTLLLGGVLLLTPVKYALDYSITGAGSFTLTGITIAVGLFGGYAAIVAVFLAIAGFSPRRPEPAPVAVTEEAAS